MALMVIPGLVACGSSPESGTISLPPAAPKPPASALKAPIAANPQPAAGFTPLPTPQQVVAALPTGRVDPFAPLAQPAAAGAPAAAASASASQLRFTGVIRTAGQAQALVQVGDQSGAVCVGRRGVCRGSGLPAFLPADWSVTSIDVASGRLVLNQAGQRRVFTL
ncbi:hypothetical protein [Synechococcus sp. CBW1107]|uniref:hypothetical protein n=1 Tax=Synechococcus sp. CBW1107 TaxID=2789857 RepID=UPI002AD24B00|nr:hypothetical protein [Synechococcus sp. CBW1107]CAK6699585.1 hypothetical protein MNNICLKF_02687 [Synechococcus sp. CBW1107]